MQGRQLILFFVLFSATLFLASCLDEQDIELPPPDEDQSLIDRILWVAEKDKVSALSPDTGEIYFTLSDSRDVIDLVADQSGRLWLLFDDHLQTYNMQGHLLADSSFESSTHYKPYIELAPDGEGVWVGVGNKLRYFDGQGPQSYKHFPYPLYGLATMAESSAMWAFGRPFFGMHTIELLDRYAERQENFHLLPGEIGYQLLWDKTFDNLWVATSFGLMRYDGQGRRQQYHPIFNVKDKVTDNQGGIWFSTEKFLYHLSVEGKISWVVSAYSASESLLIRDLQQWMASYGLPVKRH